MNGYHVGVKDLPPAVRPRERPQARGASDLSDPELLATIVRTGTPSCNALELSTRALARHGGLAGVLDHVVIGGGRFVSLKERGLGFVR